MRQIKILVIELSNIGDAILTLPALHALWKAHPASECHFLCSPRVSDLFAKDPRVHRIWRWEKSASPLGKAALIFQLFAQRFGLVVDFRHSLIPLLLVGAKRTPLFRLPVRQAGRSSQVLHRAQQHLQLVRSLGIPASNGLSPLRVNQEDEKNIHHFINAERPLVVMAPGARSHLKRWGAARFSEVADRLIEERRVQVILVGEQAEQSISQEVVTSMRHPVVDLTGRTTLTELAALLAKAALVVTNDSACLHAADAMGTPTVAIFGPTDERKYGPRDPRSKVVRLSLVCAPCELALCPYQHECMRWITADEVYAAALQIFAKDGKEGTDA